MYNQWATSKCAILDTLTLYCLHVFGAHICKEGTECCHREGECSSSNNMHTHKSTHVAHASCEAAELLLFCTAPCLSQ